jgi:hypothetical protein
MAGRRFRKLPAAGGLDTSRRSAVRRGGEDRKTNLLSRSDSSCLSAGDLAATRLLCWHIGKSAVESVCSMASNLPFVQADGTGIASTFSRSCGSMPILTKESRSCGRR